MKNTKKEFNLSEKAGLVGKESNFRKEHVIYFEEDIKEFIKIVKEEVLIYGRRALPRIDKLAGDKLI